MQIEVLAVHLDVTASLSDYARRRIEQSLDRFEDRIQRVEVRLDDISGPHGPGTKRCHIEVHLWHRESVIVEQDHNDVYTAVDKAATRLKRAVRRQINRIRDARRAHQHRSPMRTAWA
jgi:ribosome hibernation promoting factor